MSLFVSMRLDGMDLNCNAGCKQKRKAEFSVFTPSDVGDIPVPIKSSRLEYTPCAKHLVPILKKIAKRMLK